MENNLTQKLKQVMQIARIEKLIKQKTKELSEESRSFSPKNRDSDLSMTGGLLSHVILWTTFVFIVVMLVWAHFSMLDIVTRASGKIIPSQKTQVIDNLEGGIVKEILVKEGDVVNKNEVLIRLDSTAFSSSYEENEQRILGLKVKIKRLEAESAGISFEPDPSLQQAVPDLVRNEQSLYLSRRDEYANMQSRKKLLHQEIEMTKPLVKKGAASAVELLHLEARIREIDGGINNYNSSVLKELNDAKVELSRLEQNRSALEDRVGRTSIRSSVRGIVKQIYITTIGGVTKPGMPLIEVVPLDDTLLLEARVKPNDIGFLKVGEKAMVKITAYDFGIYGGLPGRVEHISADTSNDEKGNSYYEIWVRTDRNYLEKDGNRLDIMPGMQATVDILTGRKSVLDYLLKPILKAKQAALSER